MASKLDTDTILLGVSQIRLLIENQPTPDPSDPLGLWKQAMLGQCGAVEGLVKHTLQQDAEIELLQAEIRRLGGG